MLISILESLRYYFQAGGFVMWPLSLLTLILWYALGFRIYLATTHESLRVSKNSLSFFQTISTSIVVVSPLLGLLGTVSGMIETFDSMGDMSLYAQSGGIAGGISQALISTQMGLAVALPGLFLGRLLSAREEKAVKELHYAS